MRLASLLTLTAALFFTGVVWALARHGKLDSSDGLVLVGLFLFWQCFQVFDVLKYNVRQRVRYGLKFYIDVVVVLVVRCGPGSRRGPRPRRRTRWQVRQGRRSRSGDA